MKEEIPTTPLGPVGQALLELRTPENRASDEAFISTWSRIFDNFKGSDADHWPIYAEIDHYCIDAFNPDILVEEKEIGHKLIDCLTERLMARDNYFAELLMRVNKPAWDANRLEAAIHNEGMGMAQSLQEEAKTKLAEIETIYKTKLGNIAIEYWEAVGPRKDTLKLPSFQSGSVDEPFFIRKIVRYAQGDSEQPTDKARDYSNFIKNALNLYAHIIRGEALADLTREEVFELQKKITKEELEKVASEQKKE